MDPAETNHSHAPRTTRTHDSHFASMQLAMPTCSISGALELGTVDSAQEWPRHLSSNFFVHRVCKSCSPIVIKDNSINCQLMARQLWYSMFRASLISHSLDPHQGSSWRLPTARMEHVGSIARQ